MTRDLEAENALPREAVKAAQAVMREYQRYPVPTITTAEDALKAALPYLRAALSASGEQDGRWKQLIELANAVLREHDPDHIGNNAIEMADLAKAIAEDAAISPPSASEQSAPNAHTTVGRIKAAVAALELGQHDDAITILRRALQAVAS